LTAMGSMTLIGNWPPNWSSRLSWQDVTSRLIARPQLDQLSAALLTAVKCMHGNVVQNNT
ncbi:MAG: hypothetical protein WBD83_17715, partial [Xanthobacteraceae bacterium]